MSTTFFKSDFFTKRFFILLFALTAIAFIIRVINITYASMWSDELYSMLSIHPGNSLYEVLYMQRKDQPPLYFVLLRYWTQLFGFNDVSARSLSVLIGTLSVFAMGFVNEKLFNARVGLLSAFITAFGFAQIEHSLEARFYGLLFLLVCVSLYTYSLTLHGKYKFLVHVLHGGLCGAIILSHHFGAMVVLAYAVCDFVLLIRKRFHFSLLLNISVTYIVCLLVLLPWLLFVYDTVKEVRDYWLTFIDVPSYLLYNIRYNLVSQVILMSCSAAGLIFSKYRSSIIVSVMLLQVFLVIVIPVIFSYAFFPMLVSRYSFAMAPALYSLMAVGLIALLEKNNFYKAPIFFVLIVLLSYDGVKASFFDKMPLSKETWREMAQWLKKQPDLDSTVLFSAGYELKGRFTIDYYLPEKKARQLKLDSTGLSKLQRFYLVESNGHDVLPKELKSHLKSNYSYREIFFGSPIPGKGGTVTIFQAK